MKDYNILSAVESLITLFVVWNIFVASLLWDVLGQLKYQVVYTRAFYWGKKYILYIHAQGFHF